MSGNLGEKEVISDSLSLMISDSLSLSLRNDQHVLHPELIS